MTLQTTEFPIEKPANYKFNQFKLVGDNVVELKRIVAHHFEILDTDVVRNNEAARNILDWCKSDRGKWIMENAFETPYYDFYKRADRWSVEFKIVATFTTKKLSEYYLRWK